MMSISIFQISHQLPLTGNILLTDSSLLCDVITWIIIVTGFSTLVNVHAEVFSRNISDNCHNACIVLEIVLLIVYWLYMSFITQYLWFTQAYQLDSLIRLSFPCIIQALSMIEVCSVLYHIVVSSISNIAIKPLKAELLENKSLK